MNVRDAVLRRRSIRAFRSDPVPASIVEELLRTASRAPSGGNLQPWHVRALTGEPLARLLETIGREGPDPTPGYAIYPDNLWEPYRTRRYATGEAMYRAASIARDDKAGRMRQLGENFRFFGAPVGLFVFIDRNLGPPQWVDLGLFLQSLMLLAVDAGLDTCAQEFWALYAGKVERQLGMPDDLMLFCGLALGYREEEAPINTLSTARADPAEWCQLHGFPDSPR